MAARQGIVELPEMQNSTRSFAKSQRNDTVRGKLGVARPPSFLFCNRGAIIPFHEKKLAARRSRAANAAAFERLVARWSQIREIAPSEHEAVC